MHATIGKFEHKTEFNIWNWKSIITCSERRQQTDQAKKRYIEDLKLNGNIFNQHSKFLRVFEVHTTLKPN